MVHTSGGWSERRVETQEAGLILLGKKLWGLVDGSVRQPGHERPIEEAASLGFDIATVMAYVLVGVGDDQIQQLFAFPLSSKNQWDQLKIIHNTVRRSRLVPLTRRFNNYQIKADDFIY